ncbi:MAG TPA: ParA family protein, partial [Actinomycetota bacterium]|nr:ParA family protein [Actinomycetota bacterium]
MRFRDQPEDLDPVTEVPEATRPAAARADFELLRRLEFESNQSPNGVFKLHPMAARVPSKPAAVHELIEPEPIVRLVSPWPGGEAEDLEEEEEDKPSAPVVEDVAEQPRAEPPVRAASGDARKPKVIVVDRAGKLAVDLGNAAEGLDPEPEVLKLDRPTEIVEVAAGEDPDVIVFGLEEVNGAGLKRLAQVHKAQPKIVIVLSDNRRKTWTAAQMAASGASDFLPANPTRARLKNKLTAALATAAQLRVESVVVTERVVVQDPPPEVSKAERVPASLARVFTVASASGGSGKTVVATNLAAYLVKATAARVLLVDLDLQFGE